MKRAFALLVILSGLIFPLACSDNNPNTTPTQPSAPSGATNTPIPTFTFTSIIVSTPGTPTYTPTYTFAQPPYVGAFGLTSAPNALYYSGGQLFVAEYDGVLPMMQIFDSSTWGMNSAANYMVTGTALSPTTVIMQGPQGIAYTGGYFCVLDGTASGGATIYAGLGLPSGPLTVSTWGSRLFKSPKGFTGDNSGTGHLYLADTGNAKVQYYNVSGSPGSFPLHEWGGFFNGTVYVPFVKPIAVACDSSDNVYVGDAGYTPSLISKFSPGGVTFLGSWQTVPNCSIRGMTLDASNNVYIADFANAQVEEYDSTGSLLRAWGLAQGPAMALPFGPSSIALTGANIFVGDFSNQQIVVFGP